MFGEAFGLVFQDAVGEILKFLSQRLFAGLRHFTQQGDFFFRLFAFFFQTRADACQLTIQHGELLAQLLILVQYLCMLGFERAQPLLLNGLLSRLLRVLLCPHEQHGDKTTARDTQDERNTDNQ